jgi:hypothetical protein
MATTTPNYGWSVPTSTDYVAQGAVAIETLGDSVDATLFSALGGAYPGLRLVKKQTIGSAVSSVTVSDAFSATYQNYLIQVSGGANSALGASLSFRLGGLTTGYYGAFPYSTYGNVLALTGSSNTSSLPYFGMATTNGMTANIAINNPFLVMRTMFMADYFDNSGGGHTTGFVDSATSQTAFTLTTSSGNMTGGTIYVYGYGIS